MADDINISISENEDINVTILENESINVVLSDCVPISWGSITGDLENQEDLQSALDDKVNVEGYIAYSQAEKEKLEALENITSIGEGLSLVGGELSADAQPQLQSDFEQEDNTKPDFIKNKPSIPSKTSDLSNDSGFITSDDVPTALSELSDDSTHRLVTDTEKSTWNSKQNALGFTPENVANKATSFQATPDDTKYPTEKLVKDSLDLKANLSGADFTGNISALNLSGNNTGDQLFSVDGETFSNSILTFQNQDKNIVFKVEDGEILNIDLASSIAVEDINVAKKLNIGTTTDISIDGSTGCLIVGNNTIINTLSETCPSLGINVLKRQSSNAIECIDFDSNNIFSVNALGNLKATLIKTPNVSVNGADVGKLSMKGSDNLSSTYDFQILNSGGTTVARISNAGSAIFASTGQFGGACQANQFYITSSSYTISASATGITYSSANVAGRGHHFIAGGSERFTILQGGNCGFGTINPQASVHIVGTLRVGGQSLFNIGEGVGEFTLFDNPAGMTVFQVDGENKFILLAEEGLYKVAIGHANPTEALDVSENINLSGVLKINGTQVLTDQQDPITSAKVNYTTGNLDTEAELITAFNSTNTTINSILTALRTHGLIAT